MIPALTARLTPAFSVSCEGKVHSVFDRAVNLAFDLPGGERLLTLTDPKLPPVPDSVCAPREIRQGLETGIPAALDGHQMTLGGKKYALRPDPDYTGRAERFASLPRAEEYLRETQALKSGFDLLPPARAGAALRALCTPGALEYLGLGCGLTPSFDDACVGVLAVYASLGIPAPFILSGLERTTRISARYLTLAGEGYFGDTVLRMIASLAGRGDLKSCLEELLGTGATSGADTAVGIREAVKALRNG